MYRFGSAMKFFAIVMLGVFVHNPVAGDCPWITGQSLRIFIILTAYSMGYRDWRL